MSNALTLARPYARAAFALARDAGRLPGWSKLLGFAATAAAYPQVRSVLGHPGLEDADAVALLLPDGEIDPNFRGFVGVLADNGRLALLPEIAAQYEVLRAQAERVVKARVTSATPLDEAGLEGIRAALARRFGDLAIEIETAVDPALLGGAVIDTGETVIDGSLRGKLARMHGALTH